MKKIKDGLRGHWEIIKQTNIYLWEFQEKRERSRRIFEEILAEFGERHETTNSRAQ